MEKFKTVKVFLYQKIVSESIVVRSSKFLGRLLRKSDYG